MNIHIYPLNDTWEHELHEGCACSPSQNRDGYWIHVSYDGREDRDDNGTPPFNWTFETTDDNE
jgi:hypothetical protein